MQFDARTAKLLAPGQHLTIDDCPGLRLHATTTGRAWLYRYKSMVDQRMRQVKLGQWPAMSPAAAMVKWEELRTARDAGRDPATEKRTERQAEKVAVAAARNASETTVRKVCEWYLIGHVDRNRKEKGSKEARRMFDTMLSDMADLPAASFTRAQAFTLLERFLDSPVQGSRLRAELAAAWDYALDAGRLPETTPNWWRQIMRGGLRSKGHKVQGKFVGTTKRVLSAAEVKELVAWLPNFSRVTIDVLTLYLWTCTRGSEIVAMSSKEISEEADGLWWTIPKERTKNARHQQASDMRVPLIGRAEAIVRRRLQVAEEYGGLLFPARSGKVPIEQKNIGVAIHWHQPYSNTTPERIRPRLTVLNWAPHDLRRTSRTFLAMLECPDSVAEAILGHMQEGIKGIYNRHTYDRERRVWLTRLSAYLDGVIAGA